MNKLTKQLTTTAKKLASKRVLATALKATTVAVVAGTAFSYVTTAQAATISESQVQQYAQSMKQAANSQNIGRIAKLISDDAIISLSRNGKTSSLDKAAYLKLLQRSWNGTSNYHYDIVVSGVVSSGSQARANVQTIETFVEDGKPVEFITNSRATLGVDASNLVLLRSVSQVTINK